MKVLRQNSHKEGKSLQTLSIEEQIELLHEAIAHHEAKIDEYQRKIDLLEGREKVEFESSEDSLF